MGRGYEWATYARTRAAAAQRKLGKRIFGRSLHIRFVDAGACGACISEARQLNNPYYNMHRLGFFMTPTPRNADVLLVSGPVSDAMRLPLRKAYDAMPEPKRVVAIGACAIFGRRLRIRASPPRAAPTRSSRSMSSSPDARRRRLAILHGLLLVVERKPPSALRFAAPADRKRAGHEHGRPALLRVLCPLRCGRRRGVRGSRAMELAVLAARRVAARRSSFWRREPLCARRRCSFHAELWPVLSLGDDALPPTGCPRFFLFVTGLVFLPVSIFSGRLSRQYRGHTACGISASSITRCSPRSCWS